MVSVVAPGYGGDVNFNGCYFALGVGTPTITNLMVFQVGYLEKTYFNNCEFGAVTNDVVQSGLNIADTANLMAIVNKNSDPTLQYVYTRLGNYSRDNSTFNHSKSSLKLTTANSQNCTYSQTVSSQNGVALTVAGSLQINAAYLSGAYTLPTVTISGLGITPQTFTASASSGTWQDWTFTATQTSGYDGNLTVTYTGQSATTTGAVYFDGLISTVFVTFARFYGYKFNTSTPVLTTDSIIQASKAVASAYTGIGISGTTITLTSNHSIREIYDYIHYYLQLPANLGTSEFFTSTDGVNFSSTYNLTLSGGNLTGIGNLSLGAMTLTRTTETTTVPITYLSGTAVFGNISVSGLVANSRVYLNNTTDNISLYNGVVAATSVSIPATWTANKTLDLRVTNVIGTTAYLPYQSAGFFTSSGASFTASQVLDSVYNGNAIDGSTVTYFTSDYPSIQVDFTSGSSVTIQELYAWYQYATHSSQGIVYYFKGLIAQDSVNYVIDVNIVDLFIDNTSGANILMVGGYLSRDNGTSYIYPLTAHSIIPVYDRAYIAGSTQILNNTNLIPALL
jgi:hypothetical protein